MSNKRTKNSIWDLVTLNKTIHDEELTNENINKKRKIILNNSQKLKSVQYKTSASSNREFQIAKYLSSSINYSTPSEYSSFPILRSTSYSNDFITSLNPVVWVDASDLTSILRDSANNVYQILDKSGNNNHLYQNTLVNQPKYHNGGLLFNSNQYLVSNNTFTQSINNMSMFVILKQYNQSTNQGIISGRSTTATSDNNNTNAWTLFGSDASTFQYQFVTNSTTIKNTNDITKTMPYGIYEIIINDNVGSLYYDGTLINTTTFTGLGSFTNLILGARYLSSNYSNFFNGEIYEVLILDSVLNTGDRYKVEKYLLDKWSTTQISRTIPLTNIYTWLDASSPNNFTLDANNKVLSWKDKNNNLNFTQSNASFYPVFDTNKVIFNNSYLSMSDASGLNLNNFSIFYVFQENTHNDNAGLLSCINSLGQTDNTVTNGFALTTPTSGNVRLSINSINLTYNGGNPLTKKLYEFNVVNGNGSIYVNGVLQSTTNFNTLGTGKIFSIGARQNSSIFDTSNPLQANIYELIIISTNTSYSQRNQIYSYLSEKWNITISSVSPAPNPTFWLDSNNNSSITVNGSNQITSWSDLSSNNYATSINNTKPILQTVNGKKLAYFSGSDVSINFSTNLTGANNSIYVVFSVNSLVGSNRRLISFNNGTNDTGSNTFNLNSNTGNGILRYNSNTNLLSTVNFNNSLYIFSLQRNNNVTSIYINNYLINTITNNTNYNFAKLNLGSIFGGSNFWTGYIPEVIVYTTLLDESSNTNTINYLTNKWGITMQPSLINEYIPRSVNTEVKFVPFTNIFSSNTNYLTISDTNNKTGTLNLNINVPITNTLPNQLSIISTDSVYLSVIDKNVIYNLSLFVSESSIVLPALTYENDYFAFINNTSYDITITGPNSLSSIINANTTTPTYFTNLSGSYDVGSSFTGFTCTLNQYNNNLTDTFIVYLGGWSSSLSYIKNLYVYDTNNNYVATTGPIYFNNTYQCDFTQTLSPGTYTFVISDISSDTGNIITSTISTSVVINNPSAILDHYNNGSSTYIITLINWSEVFSDITTLDVWVSNNSSYTGSTYLLTTETIQENSGVYTASFTHEFGEGYYWISLRKVTSIHNLIINITNPIVRTPTFNFSLDQTTHTSPYNVILGGWNNSLTSSIPTLYIFGYLNSDFSDTPILLLSVDTTNITYVGSVYKLPFTYVFDVARTYYLSVSDTDDLTGGFNVELTNHINPLTITATCNLTYGFTNYNNVFTLTLSNNESYDLSLYRTKWFIYHADNNSGNNFKLITRSTLNSNQTIIFTFNPSSSLSNPQYFYISNTNHTVLAIGNGNLTNAPIAYSYDITNWYYAPSSIQLFCQNLSYPDQNVNITASDGYVMVAGVNTGSPLPYQIAYSTNGIDWYGSPSGNTILNNSSGDPSLNYITLNVDKTVWVFIASNNTLATSSDGINWTKITPIIDGSSGPFYLVEYDQIVHDGTKWLMTSKFQVDSESELAKLAYSTDLINWTTINIDPNPNNMVSIMYGNSTWVGTGSNTNLYYSYDGFDWISTTTTLAFHQGPIFFVNNRFFIATNDDSSTNKPFYTSTDGIMWTECTVSPTASFSTLVGNVIWYNNKYYALLAYDIYSSPILYITIESDDGISWVNYPILNDNFTNILSTASYTLNPIDILSTTPVTFTTLSVTVSENQVSGSTVPLSISGLHGWYDGGDISTIINTTDNVTTWQDKSGNNFNATVNNVSNRPVLQSTGGILFNGTTDQYFNLPNNAIPYNNTSYTIITVFSDATSGGFISGGNSTTTRAFNSIEITNTNYVSNLWSGSGTSGNLESSHVIQAGTNIVYADYYTGSTHNLILDVLYKNNNTPSTRVQTNSNNKIGYSPVGGSLDGIINEILIFNRILTISERELLEGYLTWKWDITEYLPWTHPYKFTQPSMMPAYSKNPLDYPGIVSWYDFGDANSLSLVGTGVNIVFDKNNNNYNLNSVSGVFPVFSNGVGVTFNGSQYIRTNSFIHNLDTFTIYVVFSQSEQKSNAGVLGFISSGNNDNTVGGMSFNTGSGTSNFNVTNTNFNVSSTNTGIATNIYSIVCNAGVISIYYNGVLNGTTTISSSNGTSAKFIVGSRFTSNTLSNGLNGTLKEIMIYSLAASTQTRQELEGYLAQKWHLQFNLSANHPYRYISPGTTSKPLNPLTNNPTDRWYDGDDLLFIIGDIWYDKSLNECQVTYTGGNINIDSNIIPGMNSIQFLGDDNYFNDDFGLSIDTNEYTISFVFYMDSTITSNGRILSFYNDGENDYDNSTSIGIGQIDTNSICLYYNDTNSTPITVEFETFNFVSFIIDSVSGNVFSYLNGTLVSTDNMNITLSTTLLTIGNDGNSNGFTYKGYINEVVLHPYALKNDNRQVLEGYFAWKWELDSLLPVEHPYYDLPPIVSIPSFSPNQIGGLDIWSDANDLPNQDFIDGQTITNWPNRSTSSVYTGFSEYTYPVFNRWGFNGQPTVTYTPGNYTVFVNSSNQNPYVTTVATLLGISKNDGGNTSVITGARMPSLIGYTPYGKNGLVLNNNNISTNYIPNNTNWDNYTMVKNPDGTIQFSNYDLNLPSSSYTGSFDLGYNNYNSGNSTVSEVLVYSYNLPVYYVQKLQGYLTWKWGLQQNLSILHPFRFEMPNKEETLFTLKLGGLTSNINITTLYLFDTFSSTLLITLTNFYGNDTLGYFSTFTYRFPRAQNYLTIANTNDMSGSFNYPIPTPLQISAKLTILVTPVDTVNNWGYFNVSKTFSFVLKSYYEGSPVNFKNYYSTLKVYYSQYSNYTSLNLIGNATVSNDGTTVTFTFNYNPSTISFRSLYFYFAYSDVPNGLDSATSPVYVFFERTSLAFTLNRYSYFNPYTITMNFPVGTNLSGNVLYVYYSKNDPTYSGNVYANQTYIAPINVANYGSGTFSVTFPSPDTGRYYLTVSNVNQFGTRTINDINVNIALPIYVNTVNVSLNKNYGFFQSINQFVGLVGTYNNLVYPFPTIRIFYSTVVATQYSDLTELTGSPSTIINNFGILTTNFNFDNSTLRSPTIYFYFTADTDEVPRFDSFTYEGPLTFYDKTTLTFTLNHYDNSSDVFIVTANNWTSVLNALSPLNVYILDSNNTLVSPVIPLTLTFSSTYKGTFTFNFDFLDAGSYTIIISDSDLSSPYINYTIPTPVVVTLITPHFILQNIQFTQTQTNTISVTPFELFEPTQIPGLKLWLDAKQITASNGSSVTTWSDNSGNDYNASPAEGAPTFVTSGINGFPSVQFSTGYNMTSNIPTNTFNNGMTIFVVYQSVGTPSVNETLITRTNNNFPAPLEMYNSGRIVGATNITSPKSINNNITPSIFYANINNTNFTYSESNNFINIVNSAFTSWFDTGNLYIGTRGDYYTQFNGYMGEILIYNNPITESQKYQVEAYLAFKWNYQLPTNHPFYNLNPEATTQTVIKQNFVPTQISNLALWLDASDSSSITGSSPVTAWNDKSGLGNNATGNGTLGYVNKSIVFNGTNSYFTLPNGTLPFNNSSYSYFVVAKINSTASSNGLIGGGTNSVNNQSFNIRSSGTQITTAWTNNNSNDITTNINFVTNQIFLAESLYDGTNRNVYYNGLFDKSGIPSTTRSQTNTNNVIGSTTASQILNGNIYEIVVFSRNITVYERQQIEGYLANKWNVKIRPTLPIDITNLSIWLDAIDPIGNGTVIANNTIIPTWYDKSGNNNNFTAVTVGSIPEYKNNLIGSLPGIFFYPNNVGGYSSSNLISYTPDLTIIMVVNLPTNILGNNNTLFAHGSNLLLSRLGNTPEIALGVVGNSSTYVNLLYVPTIFYGTVTNLNKTVNLNRISSNQSISASSTYTGTNVSGSYAASIGVKNNDSFLDNGSVGEVIYFNKVLSSLEKEKMISYLSNKWNIIYPQSYAHPYISTIPPILYRINEPDIPTLFIPTQLSGLALWLDGQDLSSVVLTDNDVTQWNDKSGLDNHATGVSNPQWLTTYGISLSGSNSFTLPNGTLPFNDSSYSYYIVVKFTSRRPHSIIRGDSTGNKFELKTDLSNIITSWDQNNLTSDYEYVTDNPILIESFYSSSTGNRLMYFDSIIDNTDTPSPRTQANGNNTIGVGLIGIIYEIIVYSNVLTISQQRQVEYYLSNKWSIYYDPTSIPNLFNWIDASDTNTLFQDVNCQIPVTGNGQNVNSVLDKSSNNVIFKLSGSNSPKYDTTFINNTPSINCYYNSEHSGLVSSNYYQKSEDITIFWYGTMLSHDTNVVWTHSSDTDATSPGPSNDISIRYTGNNSVNFKTNNDTTNCVLSFVDNEPIIYWATMNNGTILNANIINSDGDIQTVSYTQPNKSWTPGIGRIWLSTSLSSLWGDVHISEYIYYQRVLSVNEINNVIRYLTNKWNILIPSNEYNIVSNPDTNSTNQSITLSLSSYCSPIYLYYGTTNMSYYNLQPLTNTITGNNIYSVNPSNNSFTFNFTNTTLSLRNIYFYASGAPNYIGKSGKSLPFAYINKNLFSIALDHYDISTNVYIITLSGYNPLLLNQPLRVMAIKNNTSYINLNQTITLTSINNSNIDFTGSFTYTFDAYNIYNIVLTNSIDSTNIVPNGDIYIQSSNIYSFSLNSSISPSNVYPGLNSPNLTFTIPGLSSNLVVSDYIPNGNVLIDNIALASNPQTMNINQININLYKYQNSGFTIWLDAKDVSSITKNANNLVSNWGDKSGLDNDAIQNTELNRPTYNSIDNSIYLTSGVNLHYLNVPPTTFNNTYYYTFSMILKVPYGFSQGDILGKFLGNARINQCNLYITSTAFNFIANTGVTFTTNFITSITNNNKFLLTFSYDGNTFKVWQNGQLLLSSVSTTGNIPNTPTFGPSFDTCCIGGTNNSNLYLYELIYNETYLCDDEIQKIESYLCNKWSIFNSVNPYMNSIISFTPNSVLYNDTINFSTTDNNITKTNSMTQLLVNCVITYTTSYKITLSNWNPTVTTVYLYVGIISKYYDRTMVQSLAVNYNSGDDTYSINLNVNSTKLTNNTYYFSLRDVNADVFGFDLRVADPNSYFTIANANYMTLSISPATCVLNQNNSLTITFTFSGSTPANIYLYSCKSIYTTGNVGTGSHDLTVITTLTTATDLTDNQATITFNPTNLPVYILASTGVGFTGYYGYSNKLTLSLSLSLSLRNTLPTSINGKIDDINEFSVDLQPHYRNIQVNNLNIIINHTIDIDNNKIVFSYDSGFESDVTFNIINSKTNQLYDSLKVIFS